MSDWPIQRWRNLPQISGDITLPVNASANALGAYGDVITATAFDAHGLLLMGYVTDTPSSALLNIATGAPGSETVLIANMLVSEGSTAGGKQVPNSAVYFPIYIPKGTRIRANCQIDVGGSSEGAHIFAGLLGAAMTAPRGGGKVTTIGAVTGSSTGTNMPANSAYTTISASTPAAFSHLVMINQFPDSGFLLGQRLAIGSAGNEVDIWTLAGATRAGTMGAAISIPIFIPKGSRISGRCVTGGASNNVVLYGVS